MRKKGFTLTELIVKLVILVILVAGIVSSIFTCRNKEPEPIGKSEIMVIPDTNIMEINERYMELCEDPRSVYIPDYIQEELAEVFIETGLGFYLSQHGKNGFLIISFFRDENSHKNVFSINYAFPDANDMNSGIKYFVWTAHDDYVTNKAGEALCALKRAFQKTCDFADYHDTYLYNCLVAENALSSAEDKIRDCIGIMRSLPSYEFPESITKRGLALFTIQVSPNTTCKFSHPYYGYVALKEITVGSSVFDISLNYRVELNEKLGYKSFVDNADEKSLSVLADALVLTDEHFGKNLFSLTQEKDELNKKIEMQKEQAKKAEHQKAQKILTERLASI